MPEVGLKRSSIDSVICKLKSCRVAQHVGMGLNAEFGCDASPLDYPREPRRRQRRAAFADKYERGLIAVTEETPLRHLSLALGLGRSQDRPSLVCLGIVRGQKPRPLVSWTRAFIMQCLGTG